MPTIIVVIIKLAWHFTLVHNGRVYETFGISKRFPIKLQLLLIRAETLDKPLTAKCFIHVVVHWCSVFQSIFSFNLLHRFCLPCVGVGKLFGWFWSCVGFFERPANVLDNEALAIYVVVQFSYVMNLQKIVFYGNLHNSDKDMPLLLL